MDEFSYKQNERAELCRKQNEILADDRGNVLSCYFDHPDGFYYDPVGNEIFEVVRTGSHPQMGYPLYVIDFGDEQKAGGLKDHGLHIWLGPGDLKIVDLT